MHDAGVSMVTEDGVTLVADVWRPAGDGPWPVLLQRLPYGRAVASTPVLPHPSWFARRGFVVVVQDCRGRGDSGGTFTPFVDEGPRRRGGDRVGGPLAVQRWPGGDVRILVPGVGAAVRCGAAPAVAARHRRDDVLPRSLRRMDVRGRLPAAAVRRVLERATRRAGAWAAVRSPSTSGRCPSARRSAMTRRHGSPNGWSTRRRRVLGRAAGPTCPRSTSRCSRCSGTSTTSRPGTARLIEALDAEAVCGPWAHMPWGSRHGGTELGEEAGPAVVSRTAGRLLRPGLRREQRPRRERSAASDSTSASDRAGGRRARGHRRAGSSGGRRRAVGTPTRATATGGSCRATPSPARPTCWWSSPSCRTRADAVDLPGRGRAEDRRDVLCYTSDVARRPAGPGRQCGTTIVDDLRSPDHDLVVTLVLVSPDGSAHAL